MKTTISFVRHGLVHNPRAIAYGRLPGFRLSDEGRRQAIGVRDALRHQPIAAIFSSPMLRARQTAGIILEAHPGLQVRVSKLINEVHVPFDGWPLEKMVARNWDIYSNPDPAYEQPDDVIARVQRFVNRIRREYAERHVVAVTHGDVVAFTLLWAGRRAIDPANKHHLDQLGVSDGYPVTASISTLTFPTDRPHAQPAISYQRPY